MTITYEYEDALYVNLTNKCNCNCEFCLASRPEGRLHLYGGLPLAGTGAHPGGGAGQLPQPGRLLLPGDRLLRLWGAHLPPGRYPLAGRPAEGAFRPKAATCAHQYQRPRQPDPRRDVVPELKGRIDTLSISLNAVTAAEYTALCHPAQGEAAYQAMLDFAREATRYVPHVVLTIVDKDKSSEEIETCRQIAAELGVKLRIRSFIDS